MAACWLGRGRPTILGRRTVALSRGALLEIPAAPLSIHGTERWFLDRVATHILAFEGHSQVVWVRKGQLCRVLTRGPTGAAARRPKPISCTGSALQAPDVLKWAQINPFTATRGALTAGRGGEAILGTAGVAPSVDIASSSPSASRN